MPTYRIVRYFQKHSKEIVREGVSLKEAQEHCDDPETSSKTCSTSEGLERTRKMGAWFDGYEEE